MITFLVSTTGTKAVDPCVRSGHVIGATVHGVLTTETFPVPLRFSFVLIFDQSRKRKKKK